MTAVPIPPLKKPSRLMRLWVIVRRLTVTWEGLYYLVVMGFVGGGAIMRQINLLMLLFGMLAAPMLFNLWSVCVMLRKAKVRRHLPTGVMAGDPVLIDLELQHTGKRGGLWAVAVRDYVELQHDDRFPVRQYPSVLFTHVPTGQSRRGHYRGTLYRRGRYVLGPMELSTRFPFGFFRYLREELVYDELLIYPQLGRLTPQWRQLWQQTFQQRTPRVAHRRGNLEGEFHGLRPWQPGDSRRWIHWRTSARQGELMVRQFEQPQQEDLLLILELWQPPLPDLYDREAIERAVSFAATLVADLCRRGGCHLLMATTGEQSQITHGAATQRLLESVLEQLAVVYGSSENHLPELFPKLLEQIRPEMRTVVVTTRPAESGQLPEQWKAALEDQTVGTTLLSRAICVDAGSQMLEEYFVLPGINARPAQPK